MLCMLRRHYKLLVACVSSVLIVLAVYWWLSWPDRTWQGFANALAKGNIERANSLCDMRSVRVESLENGKLLFSVRNEVEDQWLPWPGVSLEVDEFVRSYLPLPMSVGGHLGASSPLKIGS